MPESKKPIAKRAASSRRPRPSSAHEESIRHPPGGAPAHTDDGGQRVPPKAGDPPRPGPRPAAECVVVGVGASAGALEAFKRLLGTMPADVVVPYARHPYVQAKPETSLATRAPDDFGAILTLLRAHTDQDFSRYKTGTLARRIERRMGIRRIQRAADYVGLLREDHDEVHALFKDMLIGVTAFFRDRWAWDELSEALAPRLPAKRNEEPVRVWVPGCATGEEAYSIAMLLYEQQERQNKRLDIQVFGTDVDSEAIDIARLGIYPGSAAKDIPAARLDIFFHREGEHGPVRDYMDFPSGEPALEVGSMVFDGLKAKVRTALHQAYSSGEIVSVLAPRVQRNGDVLRVRIRVQPLPAAVKGGERRYLLSFVDEAPVATDEPAAEPGDEGGRAAAAAKAAQAEADHQLALELQATREDLQSTIEELESANEELKVSNEEIMSMNEELQSTNEELETSREELQSLNEELSTVNHQLHDKVEELEATTNDLTNLLAFREQQQAVVARLGRTGLAGEAPEALLHRAAGEVADTLGVELTQVLRVRPKRADLLLVAGTGWREGLVGQAAVSASIESQAGYTLQFGGPVISADLGKEKRFRGSALLTPSMARSAA